MNYPPPLSQFLIATPPLTLSRQSQSSSSPQREKDNNIIMQHQHRQQTRRASRMPQKQEFQNSLTSLHEHTPVLEDGSSHDGMGDCSSHRSSVTSLGSQDLELSVPPLTAPAGSASCDRFGRRPARRTLRDWHMNNSQQQMPQASEPASSQHIEAADRGDSDVSSTSINRRGSWEASTDWDSALVYNSANSSFSCTASQTSMYHVLDHLEEQDNETECDHQERKLDQSKVGSKGTYNDQQNHNNSQTSHCSSNVGGSENIVDISDRTYRTENVSAASQDDPFEMKLKASLSIPPGGAGKVFPRRGLGSSHRKQKSFRRSLHDTLKQDDSVSECFANSYGTNLTNSTDSSGVEEEDADDLEHVFGDLLVDGE